MAQTILVVDDEAKLRDMIRLYLEQEGYRVVEAGHGREALYVARVEKPDLIVRERTNFHASNQDRSERDALPE